MEKGMHIDDYIAQFEAKHGRDALASARQSLARSAYGEGPETFTRLRLAAGKSVRHVLEELPQFRLSEEDIAHGRFNTDDSALMHALGEVVGTDKVRTATAIQAECVSRTEWERDGSLHPLADAIIEDRTASS